MAEEKNPKVKDNGDGTKTLTYSQTEDQKRIEATEKAAQAKGGKK